MQTVRLAGPTDLDGFRAAARRLFAAGTAPGAVEWRADEGAAPPADLWDDAAPSLGLDGPGAALRVPAGFVTLCEQLVLHRDPGRFALMYRLLWRLRHEPVLAGDPLDPDRITAQRLAAAVRRDIHKMRAFVRFRPLADGRHVAWFEPAHHIVEANAGFFARRFAQLRWAILTPDRCVAWDGDALAFAPGAPRPPETGGGGDDAGEGSALWLTYYAHVFNPARLKVATMTREMPRRYWPNLPEARLIGGLVDAATARSTAMIDAGPTPARAARRLVPLRVATPSDIGVPQDLPSLQAAAQACRACPHGAAATQAVGGEGPLKPARMVVGEQPGDQEDLQGRPFVGPAGQLLDRALAGLGWAREALYLSNAVRHFGFTLRGRRRLHKTPGQREVQACAGWLAHEIQIVAPDALIALGATAARALLGRPVAVQAERGRWLHERADGRPVFVTLHPSALLRLPAHEFDVAFERWCADLAGARLHPR